MATTENLSTLKINYLTQAQYDTALANNQINANQLYFTPDNSSAGGTITGVTAGTGLSGGGTTGTLTLNHSNSVTAQTTQAIYPIKIDAQGHISAYGSAATIPTITLNGSATTSPSFYAPTAVGSNGNYLKSNGSGAPSWTAFPTIPTIKLNNATTTSPTFYAPTAGGTSGYYLKGNGTTAAPVWSNVPSATKLIANTNYVTTAVSASTWQIFNQVTLDAGVYIFQGTVTFASTTSSGTRIIRLTTSSTDTTRLNRSCEATMGTHSNNQNFCTFTTVLAPTASTIYYLWGWSSVALSAHSSNNAGIITYVKLL